MISEHLAKVSDQLKKGPTIGNRKTPVVSFWPMRDKWKKFGEYWELWEQDGDLEVISGSIDQMAPAELKLIYFLIPESNTICQLAYEYDPAEVECARTRIRRHNRVAENLRQGLSAVKKSLVA